MTSWLASAATVLVATAPLAACHKAAPAASVAIQSIQPPPDTQLLEGDAVIFDVTVRAQGFDKPATVGAMVQAQGSVIASSKLVPIESGQTATLRVPVRVPDVDSLQVIAPLYVGDTETTNVVDRREYKVLGRRG